MHGCGPPPGARVNAPQHNRQKRPSGSRRSHQPVPGSRLQTADSPGPSLSGRSWTQQQQQPRPGGRGSRCYFRYCVLTMCAIIICPSQKVGAGRVLGVGCSSTAGGRYDVFVQWLGSGQSCVLIRPAACVQARAPPRVMCPVCYECVCAAEPPPHPDNNTHTPFLQPQLSSEDPHHHASLKHNHPPAALIPQLSSDPGCRLWMFMIMLSVCPAAGVELHFNCSITWSLTFKKNTSLLTHMTHAISTDCQN